MIDWLMSIYSNPTMVGIFFLFPAVFNFIHYAGKAWLRIQGDAKDACGRAKRYEDGDVSYYSNRDYLSVGSIVIYIFNTFCPCVNALVFVFRALPSSLGYLIERFGSIFQFTFVKKPEKPIVKKEVDLTLK
tara:strand:+ start:629 stop:1021 length:393 start_codon:yes stop_codon:yes gene_type:complete